MRASAASQLSPAPASPLAAQEKNAGKDTSFAQMISSVATQAQKAAQDDRSSSANDKSAKPAEQTDSQVTAPTTPAGKDTQAAPQTMAAADTIADIAANAAAASAVANSAVANSAVANSAVASDVADAEPLPTEPALVAPPEPQPVPQPVPPPIAQPAAPPVPQPVVAIASPIVPAATTNDGSADTDKTEDATAPTATAQPDAAPSVAPPIPKEVAAQSVASPAAPLMTVAQSAPQQEPVQPESASPGSVQPQSAQPQSQPLVAVSQIAAPKPATPTKQTAPAHTVQAPENQAAPPGGEAVKPDTSKPQTTTDNAPGNADVIKADAANSDFVPAASAEAAAPKAAPQPQAAANTNMAAPSIAPTQTGAPIPETVQHVQVTAEAAKPNVAALAVEISAKSQSGAKQFDIRLDPPELGRVEVRLSIDAAGKASAHLSADQPQTLDLLQKDAAVLTRALRDAGLDVSQNSLNFSLRQQAHGQDSGASRGHGRSARSLSLTATRNIEATPASSAIRADGRVDIRV